MTIKSVISDKSQAGVRANEWSIKTYLGGHSVGSCGEKLRDASCLETSFGQTESSLDKLKC